MDTQLNLAEHHQYFKSRRQRRYVRNKAHKTREVVRIGLNLPSTRKPKQGR